MNVINTIVFNALTGIKNLDTAKAVEYLNNAHSSDNAEHLKAACVKNQSEYKVRQMSAVADRLIRRIKDNDVDGVVFYVTELRGLLIPVDSYIG